MLRFINISQVALEVRPMTKSSPKTAGKTVPLGLAKIFLPPNSTVGPSQPNFVIDCKHLSNRTNFFKLYFEVAKHLFYNPKSPLVSPQNFATIF